MGLAMRNDYKLYVLWGETVGESLDEAQEHPLSYAGVDAGGVRTASGALLGGGEWIDPGRAPSGAMGTAGGFPSAADRGSLGLGGSLEDSGRSGGEVSARGH